MKPIRQIIISLSLVMSVMSQKFQQEQYPFPPHFQTPSAPIFSSDSTIYLPPESSTPIPYYPTNNNNKYPIKLLPPTAIKAPSIYPTPFPMVSSTLRSNFEEEANNFKDISKLRSSHLHNTVQINKNVNSTENNINQQKENREMRSIQRMPNYLQKFGNLNLFENVDPKKAQYPANTVVQTQNGPNQNPAARRMIVTSEIQRNENGLDQVKSASFANAQYIQAPGVIIASTAEPAIPILRLSNEMDLDGSFSYEALGADQTHYVQHSRMENMGTDKEEQVVEGSYSYVGDNGQTYTVHYVADSNGYRASGDHLPVAPPIPEIIQRAIQYNLAEEARKPPHLKQSWENESKDYENDETSNRYSITSLRNLFTGRTPEAFSLGLSQGSNTQNNLVSAASTNIPVKASYDIISDQFKSKSNTPITPQITFLASQGAHNPSSQPQQIPLRSVSTEKSTLPQLVNYEANIKESDPETNKGLWRWQYGLTTNDNSNPNKNTISRSFGEGDDVIINFNDMTPEQYTRMIHSQISDQQSEDSNKFFDNSKNNNNYNKDILNYSINNEVDAINNNNNDKTGTPNSFQNLNSQDTPVTTRSSTENFVSSTTIINESTENKNFNDFYHSENHQNADGTNANIYSKIISRQNFVPKSNIVTQTYNFEDMTNDISQVDILKNNPSTIKSITDEEKYVKIETKQPSYSNNWINNSNEGISSTNFPSLNTMDNNPKFFEPESNKNDFKPVTTFDNYYEKDSSSTTTDSISINEDQMIRENIFLKSLFKPKISEYKSVNKFHNTSQRYSHTTDSYEPKEEKVAKVLQYQPNTQNEIKFNQKKPFDINDVLNYVTLKNHFESSKTRPKNIASINFSQNSNQKEVRPSRYITFDSAKNNEDNIKEDSNDSYQVNNNQQKELRGVFKNYKVLQRQRNTGHTNNNHYPELTHRNIKTFHNLGLPPLGRAGPSLKSYLPPTFV